MKRTRSGSCSMRRARWMQTARMPKPKLLLEWIYRMQEEEQDPELKVLIFTEFVPTQAMLAGIPASAGDVGGVPQWQHGLGGAEVGAEAILGRCANHDFHGCRRRGTQPPVLPRHHQFRSRVATDGAGTTDRHGSTASARSISSRR